MTTRRPAAFCLALAVTAAILFVEAEASTSRNSRPQAVPPPWLTRLSTWLEAVSEHRLGYLDMPARLAGFSTETDLGETRTDFLSLVAICRRELDRSDTPGPVVYKDTLIPFADLRALLRLTDEEAAAGNANRILKRAAVFHADVAMLVTPYLPNRIGCSMQPSMLVKDGNRIGTGCLYIHWMHSRLLLGAVRPNPGHDGFVRNWYLATATYLLETGDYANAKPHLEQARLLFRSDPEVLFARGYYQEAFASPTIQSVAVDTGDDPRLAKSYLEEAEDLFGRAVKGDPQFAEARVRRGQVLNLLGRHGDAVGELRLAAAAAKGPQLAYYAQLFLGRAEESAGNPAAARAAYERAAGLFPQAQSPRLALALLARRLGDRAAAQGAMRRVVELPGERTAASDPWTFYYRWQNVDFKARFAALHAMLADRTPQ
jgi:tetratricopeptide (TPR) repeat protein